MHQQPRTIDPPGRPKSSSRSLHVCSVSGRTSNMAAVWHPLPTEPGPHLWPCAERRGRRPHLWPCAERRTPHCPNQPCICGLVRKDAAVDPICGFVRRDGIPESHEDLAVACPGPIGRDQLGPDPSKLLSQWVRRLTQG